VTALVTGAGGFLGTALVERLLAHGWADLRCLHRSRRDERRLAELRARHPGARLESVDGDLLSPADAARAVEGIDTVFHAAAGVRGRPEEIARDTVDATRVLMEAAAGRVRRVVLVSSLAVYGASELRDGAVVDESTPLEPHPERRDPYTRAKLRQEALAAAAQRAHGFELVVLRPGVLYGPGGSGLSPRIGVPAGGVFLHVGNSNRLPLSYVENCADAAALAGAVRGAAGRVFNVHDDDLPTCAEYLRGYADAIGGMRTLPIPYAVATFLASAAEHVARFRGGPPPGITRHAAATLWRRGRRFDNAALKALGWTQRVSTAEGMRRTFAWLRAREAADFRRG
jgi:nucleoside-diphosphate-sugar epimerase